MKLLKTWAAAVAMLALAGTVQASLISQGTTVQDDVTGLIWLKDWSVNGLQNWSTQNAWAESLSFAGSDDWRLPEIGEYEALHTAYGDLHQVSAFSNVQYNYWSGTQYPGDAGYFFFAYEGGADVDGMGSPYFAVAVRAGDVATTVPEPQSLALVTLAIGAGLLATKRRPA